jgi:hypothetical protein
MRMRIRMKKKKRRKTMRIRTMMKMRIRTIKKCTTNHQAQCLVLPRGMMMRTIVRTKAKHPWKIIGIYLKSARSSSSLITKILRATNPVVKLRTARKGSCLITKIPRPINPEVGLQTMRKGSHCGTGGYGGSR